MLRKAEVKLSCNAEMQTQLPFSKMCCEVCVQGSKVVNIGLCAFLADSLFCIGLYKQDIVDLTYLLSE